MERIVLCIPARGCAVIAALCGWAVSSARDEPLAAVSRLLSEIRRQVKIRHQPLPIGLISPIDQILSDGCTEATGGQLLDLDWPTSPVILTDDPALPKEGGGEWTQWPIVELDLIGPARSTAMLYDTIAVGSGAEPALYRLDDLAERREWIDGGVIMIHQLPAEQRLHGPVACYGSLRVLSCVNSGRHTCGCAAA